MLCRNGRAIQLTDDHKPEREDEAVGGRAGQVHAAAALLQVLGLVSRKPWCATGCSM